PLCQSFYGELGKHAAGQATLRAEPGGTPSRWNPDQPGRLLLLVCQVCLGRYGWDYFAGRDFEPDEADWGAVPTTMRAAAGDGRQRFVSPSGAPPAADTRRAVALLAGGEQGDGHGGR